MKKPHTKARAKSLPICYWHCECGSRLGIIRREVDPIWISCAMCRYCFNTGCTANRPRPLIFPKTNPKKCTHRRWALRDAPLKHFTVMRQCDYCHAWRIRKVGFANWVTPTKKELKEMLLK